MTYQASPVFKRPKQPTKPCRPQQTQPYRPKSQTHHTHLVERNMLREVEIKNSSPPLSKPHPPQNSGPTLSTASRTMSRHSNGRKTGPFCGTMGRIDRQQVSPLYHLKWFQDPIQVSSSPIGWSDISVNLPPRYCKKRQHNYSRIGPWKGYGIQELPVFIPNYS